jgi:hypothetical protein
MAELTCRHVEQTARFVLDDRRRRQRSSASQGANFCGWRGLVKRAKLRRGCVPRQLFLIDQPPCVD